MAIIRERYPATVTSIEDKEGDFGRIRVACVGLLGDEETELPMIVEPAHDWGWFYMPDVGEVVEVEVVVSSDEDEIAGQSSIDNLDICWRGKRFYTDNEDQDEPTRIHSDFTALNYGKRRGFATPFGHTFIFDDTEGDPRICLTLQTEKLEQGEVPEPEKFTRVEIEPDGSLKIAFLNNHMIHLTTEAGKLRIALDGEPDAEKHFIEFDAAVPSFVLSLAEEDSVLTLDGAAPSLEVKMGGENHVIKLEDGLFNVKVAGDTALDVAGDGSDTVTTLGDGAKSAVIAEALESWLNDTYTPAVADMHDNHFHPLPDTILPLVPLTTGPTLVGSTPGGAPMAPVVPASLEDYDTAITSTHLVFPDV